MLPKIREGQTLADDGELVRGGLLEDIDVEEGEFEWSAAQCDCRFYWRWSLTCRHLFHHHFVNSSLTLTEARLLQWSNRWQEGDFELYEVRESYRVAAPEDADEHAILAYNRVAAREVTETILTSFYKLESNAVARLGQVEGRRFID
ncbi:hypothetical protein B0T26DRAFT_384927 [Lasiosphaeria miniovina]|uniref:SWIM-type domain-containing protein n=1 Tax=Lasiosphaeria miniovina TaxID=1954250 RepID=A0AA40AE29_9PEZI|nr:uncharacterized protein B0T26DRAFT_384927 [Lasiosphaeria miniovina]KAK0714099.1 hypothetical protein B0T26DRAFT_384927 [Lasiosphaeria miniovina]